MFKKGLGKFRPYYMNECEDIKFAIKQVAAQLNKDADSLDFDLQSITTYTKNFNSHALEQIEPSKVDAFLLNHNNMLEKNLAIFQRYCILVKEKEARENLFHLSADKSFSKAFLNFRVGFSYSKCNFDLLYANIKKEKAWNKILCFNEENECKALQEFLATLEYPLKKEERYLLLCGVDLEPSIEAQLSFKKDIAAQFQVVLKDELLCVYQKPVQGKPGRNIRGEYVIPSAPKTQGQICHLRYDSKSVAMLDYPCKQYFKSIVGGFLKYENNFLSIEESLEAQEVSFKTTGSLISAMDSGIVMHIKEADVLKEALGHGMKIQAAEVYIEGNVGSDAIVHAKKVYVKGLTHQTSKIYADEVKVATHKGYIKGKDIHIDALEVGIIEGVKVSINQMYGGKVFAEEIEIQTLHSNAFLYATKSIHVVYMASGENKFFLAANYSPSAKVLYEDLLKQKDNSIKEAIHLTKELKLESLELLKLKSTADEVRRVLFQYKNTKTRPPSYLLEKFEAYHARVVKAREKRDRINALREKFKSACDAIVVLDAQTKGAVVSIDSGWVGHNEVRYNFYAPHKELLCIPMPSEPTKVVYKNGKIELVL